MSLRVQNFILSVVIGIHLVFLLILIISPSFAVRKKEQKPLIVKTIVPKPPSRTTTPLEKKPPVAAPAAPSKAVTATPPAKKTAPKPAAPPAPKKEAAVAEKRLTKSKQSPPAAAKKSPPERAKISDSLLKELEESIAKMDKKSVAKTSKAIAPIPLQIDLHSSDSGEDADYTALLIRELHESLRLPDFGEVKIQLSLRQDGSVVKVVVLKAQSEKNKQYLESNLMRLKFPRFEGTYSNKKECTFILTFCNE